MTSISRMNETVFGVPGAAGASGKQSCSRRTLLQTLAALGVSFALPGLSTRAASLRRFERPRSLITLWMGGGMSQLETFDPHPGTPSGGETKAISTSAPEIQISHLLPQLAEQMHSAMLIRSLHSKEGDHERGTTFVKTGYRPEQTLKYPSIGAIATHELPDPQVEIPMHVSLSADQTFTHGGYLGNEWDAFRIFEPGQGLANLDPYVTKSRQNVRLAGVDLISRRFQRGRELPAQKTLHQDTIDRAVRMMSSDQLKAFQTDDESQELKAAYGNSRFGRGCMVARRLIEVGVRAVEVNLSGFDTHVANHEGHVTQCNIFDPAIATLIRDLRERDLLESTIVLCISEFGRTPAINATSGRDHWPNWFSCMIAGGGFREGTVIGTTPGDIPQAKDAAPSDPVSVPELYATILASLGIDPNYEMMTPIGRPMRFADATPLERLVRDPSILQVKKSGEHG